MQVDVCAIEWDGDRHLSASIDIYCFIFVIESFRPRQLALDLSLQLSRHGWCRADSPDFEPQPELAHAAMFRVYDAWVLWEVAHEPLSLTPARQLFYEPSQEVFDYRQRLDALVSGLVSRLDMNRALNRR